MYWGLSPALDLLSVLESLSVTCKTSEEVNILITGSFDCRHVLQTLAKRYTHADRRINFFVLEVVEEQYGRQLLLLTTALELGETVGPAEKPRLWMEIYGNTLVRPRTLDYLRQRAAFLVKFLTDPDARRAIPALNLSLLQYKEIDTLENVFSFFMKNKAFNPVRGWDEKLRHSLGARYDFREGVFDWDLQMKLKGMPGCGVISSQEYRYWRKSGVAFTWLETETSEPNPTLVSGIHRVGSQIRCCGLMGSVVNGPFAAFGLTVSCEDEELLKTTFEKRYMKRSTDLFERKLLRMFHEIENGAPYVHTDTSEDLNLGVTIIEQKNIEIEKLPLGRDDAENKIVPETDHESVQLPGVTINFLPCKTFRALPEKYVDFFDVIWVGHNLVDHVASSDLLKSGSTQGVLLVESSSLLVHYSKDDHSKYESKVEELATEHQYERVPGQKFSELSVAVFKKKLCES
ncbi:unnamed protein product [Bemisia tabaci]|uniref:Dynein assembly factor 3, axonemal n=1 Tax=Bemisia tabaci TaxID=7038 RepID=A0A9P0F374_BEMTA|nr:unnamed protein product [Bemisia tabaci]